MSGSVVCNRVRRAFYLDSVVLMRLSRDIASLPGVEAASLMIGTASNRDILDEAGLLDDAGRTAGANDLIVAVRATDAETGDAALDRAISMIDAPPAATAGAEGWSPRTLETGIDALPDANLALISVPGEFAAAEARRALARGLHVMIFSDNVSLADERALKQEALERGLLMMGPDCGTALIGGAPLGFANAVPRGPTGIVSASGTGLQEVSTLIARAGGGVSHGIGVGGRDLGAAVGGAMTLAAIDALDADPATERIVLVSKPPDPTAADRVLRRIGDSAKPFTVCFPGMAAPALPRNARFAATLRDAAGVPARVPPADPACVPAGARRWVRGLYCGGTLCAEAQAILRDGGDPVRSNVPLPGIAPLGGGERGHTLVDFGADEFTRGRPHPMIDPGTRDDALVAALADPTSAVVLLDVVIGYGAHPDPAGLLATALSDRRDGPLVVAAICGTEGDPQVYSTQVRKLESAGVIVTPSNADAAQFALGVIGGRSRT